MEERFEVLVVVVLNVTGLGKLVNADRIVRANLLGDWNLNFIFKNGLQKKLVVPHLATFIFFIL